MSRNRTLQLFVFAMVLAAGFTPQAYAGFPFSNHTASGSPMVQFAEGAHETGEDCNGNGVPDECDLASALSSDANGNDVPDECDIALLPGNDLCWSTSTTNGVSCSSDADCTGGRLCGTKNRYLSMTFDDGGVGPLMTALQVKVVDVLANLPSQAALMEGDVWWAAAPANFPEGPGSMATFKAAALECTASPHLRDWAAEGLLHLYGPAVIPNTKYEVRICNSSLLCGEPLVVVTARNGDVVAPFGNLQPGFVDFSGMVDKFQGNPGAIVKARAQMQANVIDPNAAITFLDISHMIDAFRGFPYPFPGESCPP